MGIQKQEEQWNGGTTLRQGLGSYSKSIHNNVFEFCRTGAPTQVKGGNFSLSTRFLEHHSVASPPTNQKKVTHPTALTPNVAFCFWGPVMTILLGLLFGPVYFSSDKGQQFQAKLLFLQEWCCNDVNDGFRQTISWLRYWEIYIQVKKQQLDPDMEHQTGSKLGKEYVKTVYCHPAYLTYMQIHHVKCWAGWSVNWNQDCQEKYQ